MTRYGGAPDVGVQAEDMKEAKRTPGEWQVLPGEDYALPGQNVITDETATRVIAVLDAIESRDKENAAFIVRACNSHDGLVEALGMAKTTLEAVFIEDRRNLAAHNAATHAAVALARAEKKPDA